MLQTTVQFQSSRFRLLRLRHACAVFAIAFGLVACPGCGKSEPELPKELQELQRKPDMYEAEIQGFQMEVPIGWTLETKGTSTFFLIPGLALGRVTIEMSLKPYSAAETADSVVKKTMDSFDRSTGSYMHQKLHKSRYPGLEEVSTKSKKPKGIPNRIYYLIGTPAGKVTIIADFAEPADLATYQKPLHYLASSLNLP